MTRVAGSSPEMWAQIFLDNGDELVKAVNAIDLQFNELRRYVEARDHDAIHRWFTEGRSWFQRSTVV